MICYLQWSILSRRTWPLSSFHQGYHNRPFNTLSSADNTATGFFPLLLPLLLSTSACWVTQGLSLWPSSYLHSLPMNGWSHPLPVVLNTDRMPPPESVNLQPQPFSWTLVLNPTVGLIPSLWCVWGISNSNTRNRTPGLPHLTRKSVFILSVNSNPIFLAFLTQSMRKSRSLHFYVYPQSGPLLPFSLLSLSTKPPSALMWIIAVAPK